MSYHAGISPNLAGLGFKPCDPHIRCNGCGVCVVIKFPPPAWFLDGKAPKGWKRRGGEGQAREDYCPACFTKSTSFTKP